MRLARGEDKLGCKGKDYNLDVQTYCQQRNTKASQATFPQIELL